MRPVYLGKDIARIDKENLVVLLILIKKPECRRQRDGVEHVGRQGEHGVDQALFNQGFTDIRLAVAGVGCRICHHEGGAALILQ